MLDVRGDGARGFGRRICQIAKDVQVVERRERARQVAVDELQRPAPRFEPHLHQDAGGVLDVIACRLDQPRHLAQLGHHPARPLRLRRIREEGLAGEACPENVGVEVRVPLPMPKRLQLVHPRFDVGGDDPVLDLFDGGELRGVDLMEAAAKAGERPGMGVDRRPAQVLDEVVMEMDAVEAGLARKHLVQVREVVVDEMRERLRWVHARS
jgi:hypothetical protein